MGIKLESINLKIKRNSRNVEQKTIRRNGIKTQNGVWLTLKKIRRSSSIRRANDEKTSEYITGINKSYFWFITCNWRK
jgi:hypothetical protein